MMKIKFILGLLMLVALVTFTASASDNAPKNEVNTELISQRIAAFQIVEAQVEFKKLGVIDMVITKITVDPCGGQQNCYCVTTTTDDGCADGVKVTKTSCYTYTGCSPTCYEFLFYEQYLFYLVPPCD